MGCVGMLFLLLPCGVLLITAPQPTYHKGHRDRDRGPAASQAEGGLGLCLGHLWAPRPMGEPPPAPLAVAATTLAGELRTTLLVSATAEGELHSASCVAALVGGELQPAPLTFATSPLRGELTPAPEIDWRSRIRAARAEPLSARGGDKGGGRRGADVLLVSAAADELAPPPPLACTPALPGDEIPDAPADAADDKLLLGALLPKGKLPPTPGDELPAAAAEELPPFATGFIAARDRPMVFFDGGHCREPWGQASFGEA